MISRIPLRVWIGLGVAIAFLALWGAYNYQKSRADREADKAVVAQASTKALDQVATKTDSIRTEQQDKETQVDAIQGSDQKLPDGYGRDLQRVRDGRNRDSR